MADAKVVSITGTFQPTASGQPVTAVVERLEAALALAKSGRLCAVGVALVLDDGGVITYENGYAMRHQGSADLFVAASRLLRRVEELFGDA